MSENLLPNITKAMTGEYQLNLTLMFQEAWRRVYGIKKTYWRALGFIVLIALGINLVVDFFEGFLGHFGLVNTVKLIDFSNKIVSNLFLTLFSINLLFLMINYIAERPVFAEMVFISDGYAKRLISMMIVLGVFTGIVFVALGLLGIFLYQVSIWLVGVYAVLVSFLFFYAYISMFMACMLVREKGLKMIAAIKMAFLAIYKHLFKNIYIWLVMAIFGIVSVILTLGIGAIWVWPMYANFRAIWYREIFGIEQMVLF